MITPFENIMRRKLGERYSKRADDLVAGSVSEANYKPACAYLACLRDVLEMMNEAHKESLDPK